MFKETMATKKKHFFIRIIPISNIYFLAQTMNEHEQWKVFILIGKKMLKCDNNLHAFVENISTILQRKKRFLSK